MVYILTQDRVVSDIWSNSAEKSLITKHAPYKDDLNLKGSFVNTCIHRVNHTMKVQGCMKALWCCLKDMTLFPLNTGSPDENKEY